MYFFKESVEQPKGEESLKVNAFLRISLSEALRLENDVARWDGAVYPSQSHGLIEVIELVIDMGRCRINKILVIAQIGAGLISI